MHHVLLLCAVLLLLLRFRLHSLYFRNKLVCAHGIAVVCSTLFVLHFCVRSGSLAFHWEVLCCKVLPDFRL